jgi:hypothetical protein
MRLGEETVGHIQITEHAAQISRELEQIQGLADRKTSGFWRFTKSVTRFNRPESKSFLSGSVTSY